MDKQKLAKITELCDRNICRSCGLQTFNTTDTNANMGSLDHGNIVGAIANGQE
jgi:hypothetical protein